MFSPQFDAPQFHQSQYITIIKIIKIIIVIIIVIIIINIINIVTFSLFHSKLKTYLFRKSYRPP